MVGFAIGYGEILLYAGDAAHTHVLRDFHCIGAPRSDHLFARSDKPSIDNLPIDLSGVAKQPHQLLQITVRHLLLDFYGNHTA